MWTLRRLPRGRSTGSVSVVLAMAVAAATLVGVLGSSTGAAFVRISDGSAWLWSTVNGWLTHVNGPSGTPDFNVPVPGSRGHRVELSQDGVSILIFDLDTGVVSRIDPTGMGLLSRSFGPGAFRVLARGEIAYLVEETTGTVTRIDPRTLDVIGAPVRVGAPVTGAGIDTDDVLWVAVAARGELVAVRRDRSVAPVPVARPGGRLTMTIAAGRPVAVDATAPALVPVSARGAGTAVPLPPPAGGGRTLLVSPSVEGRVVPVLVEGTSVLFLVDLDQGSGAGSGAIRQVLLDSQAPSARLGAPVVNAGRVYVPDHGSGRVLVYDMERGRFEAPILMAGGPGLLTVFVHGDSVWINRADGADAVTIGPDGRVRRVNKYAPNVPVVAAMTDARLPEAPRTASPAPRAAPGGGKTRPYQPPQAARPPPPSSTGPPQSQPRTTQAPPPPPQTAQASPPPPQSTQASPPPPQSTQPPSPPSPSPMIWTPGVPSVSAQAAAGAIIVTVRATNGGPVSSFALAVNPGTTITLIAPGTVTVPVAGCALATATATATGPGGTSAASAPARALGCVPPGPVQNVRSQIVPGLLGVPTLRVTWDPPTNAGGGTVTYRVNVVGGLLDGLVAVVTGTLFERPVPLGGGNPYSQVNITSQNQVGSGPQITVYP
jgi:hypothetical protein